MASWDLFSSAAVTEIVEQRHAVRFGPNANHSSSGEGLVVPLDRFLPVEGDSEMIATEIGAQAVPLAGCNFHCGALLLGALAFDRVVNADVVFEGVGASDVIVIRILGPPNHAARLVFLSRHRLELHFDKTVLDARLVLETDGISG